MAEDTEIDPEVLRTEVEQIKDAMGLHERYPSQFQLWLVFGVLVLIASLGSQMIALRDMPGYLHGVLWWVLLGGGGFYLGWTNRDSTENAGSTGTKPRIGVLWLAVFALYAVYVLTLGPAIEGMDAAASEMLLFSLIVALIGVAYLVVGEALRAYYIRRRDRWSFYLGGAWILVLAVLMPNVAFFHTWGYATFGVTYAVHAAASYLVLR